jgi:hypothetical protein
MIMGMGLPLWGERRMNRQTAPLYFAAITALTASTFPFVAGSILNIL